MVKIEINIHDDCTTDRIAESIMQRQEIVLRNAIKLLEDYGVGKRKLREELAKLAESIDMLIDKI